ncbi:hypothetical protein [Tunturiibacter lichenicola]|uniref:hypothetical protein n=1 Tax=Tunturiibacter lichenicola TaxID=2051959 RepID=UPI003D9B81EB
MQRLFSIFPAGSAGVALIVLRSIVAVRVFAEARTHSTTDCAIPLDILASVVGLSLFLGFLTPYCAAVCCVAELTIVAMSWAPDVFSLWMSALTSGSVAVLGPGAYSVDAKIFGRRLIEVPSGKKPH